MSDAAIATIVSGLVTITTTLVGFLIIWVKIKYGTDKAEQAVTVATLSAAVVEEKIDENTRITKDGVDQATAAAANADHAKKVANSLSNKLNGGIDLAITEAIKPLKKALDEHEVNMKDMATKLENLSTYVHERNHNILTALQTQANHIGSILQAIQQKSK